MAKSKKRSVLKKKDKVDFQRALRIVVKSISIMTLKDCITDNYNDVIYTVNEIRDYINADDSVEVSSRTKECARLILDAIHDSVLIKDVCIEEAFALRIDNVREDVLNKVRDICDNPYGLIAYMNTVSVRATISGENVKIDDVFNGTVSSDNQQKMMLVWMVLTYATWITTYFKKYKNVGVLGMDISDGAALPVYGGDCIFSEDVISKICSGDKKSILYAGEVILRDFITPISKVYDSEKCQFFNNMNGIRTVYLNDGFCEYNLISGNDLGFSDQDVLDMFEKRRYGIPVQGVKLDFSNKSKKVESIYIKENASVIAVKVKFSDVKNIRVMTQDSEYQWLRHCSKINRLDDSLAMNYTSDAPEGMYVAVEFNKLSLGDSFSIDEFIATLKSPNLKICMDDDNSYSNFCILLDMILKSLYLVFCNPSIKHKGVAIAVDDGERLTRGGYTVDYRVPHIRRLPKGHSMSDEAKFNAREDGFGYIPEGYTYVQSHRSNRGVDDK